MNRRSILLALCGSLLAPDLVRTAAANPASRRDDRGDGTGSAGLGRVTISADGRQVLISAVLIARPRDTLGVPLDVPVPRFDENRLDLGTAPLLGALTRPTLARRLEDARPVGKVVLVGTALVLVADRAEAVRPKRILIAHRDTSWEPPARPRPVSVAGLPALGDLLGLPGRGRGYEKDGELLILVTPTRVRGPDG